MPKAKVSKRSKHSVARQSETSSARKSNDRSCRDIKCRINQVLRNIRSAAGLPDTLPPPINIREGERTSLGMYNGSEHAVDGLDHDRFMHLGRLFHQVSGFSLVCEYER